MNTDNESERAKMVRGLRQYADEIEAEPAELATTVPALQAQVARLNSDD